MKRVDELESVIKVNNAASEKALQDLERQKEDEKNQLKLDMERIRDENENLAEFRSKQDMLI